MKKIIIILFIACCPVCYIQAMGNLLAVIETASDSAAAAKAEREIRIKATTSSTPFLRSAPAPVVSAWLIDGQIDLTFLQDLGTISITVINNGTQGVVYQTSVSAAEGAELTIGTQGWALGTYTITITRSSGQTYSGEFEL